MRPESIYYVTGNPDKLRAATELLIPYQISVRQGLVDITEIQSDSIKAIAINKAEQAFAALHQRLFVNDAGWHIAALKGFPGPFMRHINDWFSTDDFLRLMQGHQNRAVVLEEVIAYIDNNQTKVFTHRTPGTILHHATEGDGATSDRIISLSSDGLSIAQQKNNQDFASQRQHPLWSQFGQWLNSSLPERSH